MVLVEKKKSNPGLGLKKRKATQWLWLKKRKATHDFLEKRKNIRVLLEKLKNGCHNARCGIHPKKSKSKKEKKYHPQINICGGIH
ncbi:hypothetical protein [Methanolapillus ohkumae]|uniref:Uncharacterized protein n=1 Tax=Methanolapillus ohkumae TaxID=3028298 RepID=A0AA96V5P9_9EURY|nr:hypothetical protein MsAm2_09980 [Methanosarcinaceae archaeon Am2]